MVNENRAWILLVIFNFGFWFTEGDTLYSEMFLACACIVGIILLVFKKNQIKVRAWRVMEDAGRTRQLQESIDNDPEMRQALLYATNLDADGFMRFCRLLIEFRYTSDQRMLEELSNRYKKEIK